MFFDLRCNRRRRRRHRIAATAASRSQTQHTNTELRSLKYRQMHTNVWVADHGCECNEYVKRNACRVISLDWIIAKDDESTEYQCRSSVLSFIFGLVFCCCCSSLFLHLRLTAHRSIVQHQNEMMWVLHASRDSFHFDVRMYANVRTSWK